MTFSWLRPAIVVLVVLAGMPRSADAEPEPIAFGSAEAIAFDSAHCAALAWRQLAFESNALLLAPALTGVLLGADDPDHAKWKRGVLFDDDLRDDLARQSKDGRHEAGDTSDLLVGVTVALPAADLLFRLKDPDCDATMNLASDLMESFLVTGLLTQGTKLLSARRRPHSSNDFRSFFSGHTAFAGTAAGLVCANAFKNQMWGEHWLSRTAPCVVTTALASATGAYRLKADAHWATDVLVGLLVGFASGYFDLPNAAAFLHERLGVAWLKAQGGIATAQLVPTVRSRAIGLRIAVRY